MTKDEIIASLMDQLKDANARITALTDRVNELLARLTALTGLVAEQTSVITSLEKEAGKKEMELQKSNNKLKGVSKLLEKESEQQVEKPQLTDEERKFLTRPGASAGRPVATTVPRETSMRSARWNTRTFILMTHPSTSSRHIHWRR